MEELKFNVIPVTPVQTNCYILHNSKEAIVFDAGGEFDIIDTFLQSNNLKPIMLLNTHAHFDHVGAVSKFKEKYGIKFYINENDESLLQTSKASAERYGLDFDKIPVADGYLEDEQIIKFSDIEIKVIHTPGHTMGSISFLIDDRILLSGDTLFFESVGRTDFPYASQEMLLISINDKLLMLDDDIVVYPGHGRSTTIIHEKENNPFLGY